MSSVTRFIRQVTPGVNVIALPSSITYIYEFVPTTTNYVGNYTPGAMIQANAVNTPVLYGSLTGYATAPYGGTGQALTSGWIARDMGKTIKASVSTSESNPLGTGLVADSEQHFRQIQLLKPTTATFGVQGQASAGYTPYLTVYVPVSVTFAGALVSNVNVILGGTM